MPLRRINQRQQAGDLAPFILGAEQGAAVLHPVGHDRGCRIRPSRTGGVHTMPPPRGPRMSSAIATTIRRSEEHTSELQSLMRISYAVFCLKKKNKQKYTKTTHRSTDTPETP